MKKFDFENNRIIEVPDITNAEWLKCYDILISFGFTKEEINKAIDEAELKLSSLTDTSGYENIDMFKHLKVTYDIIRNSYYFTKKVYNGEWEKEVKTHGYEIRTPSTYQGLRHGDIIFNLLKNKFSWFDDDIFNLFTKVEQNKFNLDSKVKDFYHDYSNFTVKEIIELRDNPKVVKKSLWSIYELHNDSDEIYLKTEFGSLYVPYKALLKYDKKIIVERMKKYNLDYHDPIRLSGFALNHRGRTKEQYKIDKENDYANAIKPLESKEAKYLFKKLSFKQ